MGFTGWNTRGQQGLHWFWRKNKFPGLSSSRGCPHPLARGPQPAIATLQALLSSHGHHITSLIPIYLLPPSLLRTYVIHPAHLDNPGHALMTLNKTLVMQTNSLIPKIRMCGHLEKPLFYPPQPCYKRPGITMLLLWTGTSKEKEKTKCFKTFENNPIKIQLTQK